jgi:lactate dehydrogenase-like 2-hydroxyacid dehydrogenase
MFVVFTVIILLLLVIIIIFANILKKMDGYITKEAENCGKYKKYFRILDKWLEINESGRSLEEYFTENGFKNIAVYGMGKIGVHLTKGLQGCSKVKITYGIDKSVKNLMLGGCPIYTLDDHLADVDAVIVTAVFAYDEVKGELEKKLNCPIVSLEDVMESL